MSLAINYEILRLIFSSLAAFFALVNFVLSCKKMGQHGVYERKIKTTIRGAVNLCLFFLSLHVGADVVSSSSLGFEGPPSFGYGDEEANPRNITGLELAVVSECFGLVAHAFIIDAQLKLTLYLFDRVTILRRKIIAGLFWVSLIPDLGYIIFVHYSVYRLSGRRGSIGSSTDDAGHRRGVDLTSATGILMYATMCCTSIISLGYYLCCQRHSRVAFSPTINRCLLATMVLSVLRQTWAVVTNGMSHAATMRRVVFVFPEYFGLVTRVVVLWTAPLCVLLLIVTARRALWDSDTYVEETRHAQPVSSLEAPAPVHSHGNQVVKRY